MTKKIELNAYLRHLRTMAKMTQAKAAEFIGVSERTYRGLEAGTVVITPLVINALEAHLKLIEYNTTCPFCLGKFKS